MFPRPPVDVLALADRIGQRGHFDKGRSRVRGLPEFGGEWPVAVLAEEIETPGPGQIRALVTCAGNPVLSTPNGARPRPRARPARLHGLDRPLPERDDAATPTSSCPRRSPSSVPLRPRLPRPRGAQHGEVLAARSSPRRGSARTTGRSCSSWRHASGGGAGKRPAAARLKRRFYASLGPDGIVAFLLRLGPYGAGFLPFAPRPHARASSAAAPRRRPRPAAARPPRAPLHEDRAGSSSPRAASWTT